MERSARKRNVGEWKLIDGIIVALCADYGRRKHAIEEKSVPKRVRMEYIYINTRMLAAAGEIVGLPLAETVIDEIGRKIGYAKSEVGCICELSYKSLKQSVKKNIARKLYLQ